LADEYHVRIKMKAGPFAIVPDNESVIHPKKVQR
jgi:hypothetical protein